jgi:hypothetical protein
MCPIISAKFREYIRDVTLHRLLCDGEPIRDRLSMSVTSNRNCSMACRPLEGRPIVWGFFKELIKQRLSDQDETAYRDAPHWRVLEFADLN